MSSTSSKSDSGECVVCGAETVTRCSACASNGTKWMFFCSREHQKLIWSAHKRVCGANSNPLRWPRLNKTEWFEAQELFRWAIEVAQKNGKDWGQLDKEEFMRQICRVRRLQMYSAVLSEAEEVPSNSKPYEISGLAAAVRNAVSYLRGARKQFNRESTTDWIMTDITADPWGHVARIIGYHDYHFNAGSREPPSWCHFLGHRILIHYTVLGAYYKDFSALPSFKAILQYTRDRALRCAQETVASVHSVVSENIHITLLQEFSQETFRYTYDPV